MTDEVTLPRKLSEEPEASKEASKPVRPSHQKIIDQVERWANSPGLQPPQSQTSTTAKAG
ncbi:hypothetical protein [Bradyrhizobium sp. I71]|uniref:hypothetical protein n=1 Tax=Bradyrhizobium sp. I71 TaxID=2590772 RepID=UPI001EF7E368|nr:hypothetical protein [Bradyrhizobium sp. I71]ULK96218.1 hypothetical protein FJV43_26215 [Bradyrhizobium sp. I71]